MNQAICIRTSLAARRRRAFTLIELLVVTGVIAILAAITFKLAGRTHLGAKTRSTENVIRALTQILGEYELVKGPVPAMVTAKAGEVLDQRVNRDGLPAFGTPDLTTTAAAQTITFPLADGRVLERTFPIANIDQATAEDAQRFDRDLDPPQPTTALFLVEASKYTGAEALIKSLGTTFVQRTACSAWGWVPGVPAVSQFDLYAGNDSGVSRPLYVTTVNDAWGRPIRFSHPAFQGGAGAYWDPKPPPDGQGPGLVVRPRLLIGGPQSGQAVMNFDRSYQPFTPAFMLNSEGRLEPVPRVDTQGRTIRGASPAGDCDEGRHPAGRPYFYSAGPDGNPGARALNVYVDGARPQFPAETARFAAD
ncbi:MAG: type II secretion system protein [Chloroflexi bacterium]|nr:type II secretion system protein [Chloroflexota bacterium]